MFLLLPHALDKLIVIEGRFLAASGTIVIIISHVITIGRWKLITDAALDTFRETLTLTFSKDTPENAREPIVEFFASGVVIDKVASQVIILLPEVNLIILDDTRESLTILAGTREERRLAASSPGSKKNRRWFWR